MNPNMPQLSTRHVVLLAIGLALSFVLSEVFAVAQETFPPIVDGKVPQSLSEMWGDFDPRSEPLETEILEQWEEDGVVLRVVRFRIGVFKGETAMLAGVYGFPKGASGLPGLLQIHGGGQYADANACVQNAKHGYATLSIAWAGRISSSKYRVNPDGMKLFWDDKTDDPNYRLTTDWGAVDGYHAPSRNQGNQFPSAKSAEWTLDPVESPRNSGWFLCAAAARRGLTFLEKQPEVDANRLGVYGHSMGGKLTVLTSPDPRVKAAAPSCGGVSDRYNDSSLFRNTLGDDVSLKEIKCPIIFLSPANDFHGRINDLQTAVTEVQSDEFRVTCAPHHNHQDTKRFEVATMAWFDEHLKGSFACAETPRTELHLDGHEGVPSLTIRPDESKPVLSVDIFYTQLGQADGLKDDRNNTIARFWHHATATKDGDVWTGTLPLLSIDKPLWVYANVTYPLDETINGAGYYYRTYSTDEFNLSSLMTVASPEELQAANVKPTLRTSRMIETFDGDWQKEWFTYTTDKWGRRTHKVYDPQWAAPVDSKLAIEVQTAQANTLVVGIDDFAAEVELDGGSDWQSIQLSHADFHDADGNALTGWQGIRELRVGDEERLRGTDGHRMIGKPWQGESPTFRSLHWAENKPSPEDGASAPLIQSEVDYPSFLSRIDMKWDRVPHRWEVAPYTGNGNVGFLFYQSAQDARNVISIHAGRHDYYDHRLPHEGNELLWIYRSRLPLGHFQLESNGNVQSADLRLSLWNAELTGTIQTDQGSYTVRGLSHSLDDVIYFETEASAGESVQISWHPDEPMPPVRATLNSGGGPKGGSWDRMRVAPLPMPPPPTLSEIDGMQFCFQPLHDHRGETTTGWEITGEPNGKQKLTASVHHSFPERNSFEMAKQNIVRSRKRLAEGTFFESHQQWWHEYYPLSFLTINDPEKEAFYWIQMYKFASATRGNGPVMDLMGPWYHKTFWPMVWGDLNVELQYWTHLTANRLSVGESLPNWFDKHAENLYKNVPDHWKDSAGLATLFPQDLDAHGGSSVPDMLCWILHDYWLHCEFAGDRERMRDQLFPKLRRTVNSYLNYLRDNPVTSDDGKIHIKNSWSPEYPGGRGQDINFTIALMRWSFQTLVDINNEHGLNDPLQTKWQEVLDNLVEFQIDQDGLRIGKGIPFDKPHRHYSHLLAFYPLAVLKPDTKEGKQLLRTTLDHWLDVTFNETNEASAMAVTGYTATGAASMYAMLGDAEKAYQYLDFFIKHDRVSPTTMYAEGNPVIESPLSFATCIHDMLLQSWDGKIRVFPGTPAKWGDVAFHHLRTQGAFLVSAKRIEGETEFVSIESLVGSPCVVHTDIANPVVSINGTIASPERFKENENGFFDVSLKKGETLTLSRTALDQTDFAIQPIAVSEADRNSFGYNAKSERLPGHQHYGANDRSRNRTR